jgi:ribosomal protein S18 acetylase RimI-like enzyme
MGRNMADFNGITYRYYDSHPTAHELEAFDPKVNDVVGYMRWDKENGRIDDVAVDPEHRRKGIATGLWNHAHTLGVINPVHSGVRSEAANAWIESLKNQ